jgi:hypothetical protein
MPSLFSSPKPPSTKIMPSKQEQEARAAEAARLRSGRGAASTRLSSTLSDMAANYGGKTTFGE